MVVEGEFPLLAVLIGLSFAIYGAIKKKADVPGDVSTFIETLLVSPIALAVIVVMELRGGPISTGVIGGLAADTPAAGGTCDLPAALPLLGGHPHDVNVALGHTHVHKSDIAASLRHIAL